MGIGQQKPGKDREKETNPYRIEASNQNKNKKEKKKKKKRIEEAKQQTDEADRNRISHE